MAERMRLGGKALDMKYIMAALSRRTPLRQLRLAAFRCRWRRRNGHNFTIVQSVFPVDCVRVGRETYGELDVRHFGNPEEGLEIGNYCSIGPDCVFLLGGNHHGNTMSTYPFRTMFHVADYEAWTKGKIVLEDDVWLGQGVTILSGVRIGKGACVAAGSIVSTDVPPYAIVGGVPAKVLRYRFSQEIIEKLLRVDMGKLTRQQIMANLDTIYTPLTEENVDQILSALQQ